MQNKKNSFQDAVTNITKKRWLIACSKITNQYSSISVITRGGVEDTRLEAKAKDTKKSEAKDSLSEDRHSRGQGQECSRPRPRTKDTSASALQKKRSSQKIFRQSPQKNVFQKIFQALHKILTIQKIVLSSSRGLDLRGQGLQNVSSRTPPLVITEIYRFKLVNFLPIFGQ